MRGKLMIGIIIIIFLCLQNIALAQDISVTKSTSKEIKSGEIISVDINITNIGIDEKHLIVKERLASSVDFNYIEPPNASGFNDPFKKMMYFRWETNILPDTSKIINYKINSKDVGYFDIPPTIIYTDDKIIYSNAVSVKILCTPNNICETGEGENYIFCPQDCSTGIKDNMCDMKNDGVCDPDCISGDPDCEKYCGDRECSGLENEVNCPEDCLKPSKKPEDIIYYFSYIIVLFIGIFITFLIYRKRKVSPEPEGNSRYPERMK